MLPLLAWRFYVAHQKKGCEFMIIGCVAVISSTMIAYPFIFLVEQLLYIFQVHGLSIILTRFVIPHLDAYVMQLFFFPLIYYLLACLYTFIHDIWILFICICFIVPVIYYFFLLISLLKFYFINLIVHFFHYVIS